MPITEPLRPTCPPPGPAGAAGVLTVLALIATVGCSSAQRQQDALEVLLQAIRYEHSEQRAVTILRRHPEAAKTEWRGAPGFVRGSTALHYAALFGFTDLAQQLLDAGADPNAALAEWRWTPLGWAADAGRPGTAAALIRAGADVNAEIGDDNTALHAAAWGGETNAADRPEAYAEVAELLIAAGADVNAVAANGATPLNVARRAGNRAVEAVLLRHGARAGTVRTVEEGVL
jgi:ankyrin repeat protein